MSGHSKWSTIKHKKAATDAKRGKIFTKVGRMITIAAREGKDGNPDNNPALRLAVEKAREANMPKDNIQRAIDRGMGKGGSGMIEEITYEGYGPNGVGIMVKVLTDNRNRTSSEMKNLFDKAGGSLGGPGSVAYLKTMNPPLMMELEEGDFNRVSALLDAFNEHDDVVEVWSNLAGYEEVEEDE